MTYMRFGTDQSQTAKVIWKFCQPGALALGFPTPFVSRDHDAWETWPPLGEVQGSPRQNYTANNVSIADGKSPPCGDPSVWANGYNGTVPSNYPRNMFGLSACCGGFIDLPGNPTFGMQPQAEPVANVAFPAMFGAKPPPEVWNVPKAGSLPKLVWPNPVGFLQNPAITLGSKPPPEKWIVRDGLGKVVAEFGSLPPALPIVLGAKPTVKDWWERIPSSLGPIAWTFPAGPGQLSPLPFFGAKPPKKIWTPRPSLPMAAGSWPIPPTFANPVPVLGSKPPLEEFPIGRPRQFQGGLQQAAGAWPIPPTCANPVPVLGSKPPPEEFPIGRPRQFQGGMQQAAGAWPVPTAFADPQRVFGSVPPPETGQIVRQRNGGLGLVS